MGCAVVAAGPNIVSGTKGCWVSGGRSSEGRLVASGVDDGVDDGVGTVVDTVVGTVVDSGAASGADEGTVGGRSGVVVGSGCSIAAPAALARNASILGEVAADVGPVDAVGVVDAGVAGADGGGEVGGGVGGTVTGGRAVMGGRAGADGG